MKKDQELLEAARIGNLELIQKLLSTRSRSSILASSFGLKLGANVNCQDQSGYTPLHHAALNGHKAVIRYILQHAASVNICDNKGNFPLHLAAWRGYHEIVYTLLTHGPSIAKVNEKNGDNETALHSASQYGHTDVVRILLDNGADPSVRNIHDESPLDLASQYGRLGVVRLLLHYQPSLLSRLPQCFSPLHLAARNGHREVVELLLAHGADINYCGDNGSALHEAALFGKVEVVRLLLSRGADPLVTDSQGRTPLELVKQLDTRISRGIVQLITSRMQDGEDYEPLKEESRNSMILDCARRFVRESVVDFDASFPHSDATKGYLGGSVHQDSDSPAKPLKVVVADHRTDGAAGFNTPSRSGSRRSVKGAWSRMTFNLRRSSSTRSSKSLPRLPSTRSQSPGSSFGSPDLSRTSLLRRQYHPSSNMFPVSPMLHNRSVGDWSQNPSLIPVSSLSVTSLPTIPAKHQQTVKPLTRKPLESEDEDTFLSSTSLNAPQTVNKIKRARSMEPHSAPARDLKRIRDFSTNNGDKNPSDDSHKNSSNSNDRKMLPDTTNMMHSPVHPKKPIRRKLSTISSPPPIPPKPSTIVGKSKVRPHSLAKDKYASEEESKSSSRNSFVARSSPTKSYNTDRSADDAPSRDTLGSSVITTSGASSPFRSPPSPHSAMYEISEALQQALSQDITINRNFPTNGTDSSGVYDSVPLEVSKPSDVIVTPRQSSYMPSSASIELLKQPLTSTNATTQPSMVTEFDSSSVTRVASRDKSEKKWEVKRSLVLNNGTNESSSNVASLQANPVKIQPRLNGNWTTRQAIKTMPKANEVLEAAAEKHPVLAEQPNMHEAEIKPAPRVKPRTTNKALIANKPTVKPRIKPKLPPKPVIRTGTKPAAGSIRVEPVRTSVNCTEDIIHDSSKCFVVNNMEVKRARILSTRSSESGPASPQIDPELTPRVDPSTGYFVSSCGVDGVSETVSTKNNSDVADFIKDASKRKASKSPMNQRLRSDDTTPVNEKPEFQYDVPTVALSKIVIPDSASKDPPSDTNLSTVDSSSVVSWDDALSDRTEDFEMPAEMRKFRGLMRGSNYHSKSGYQYSSVPRDLSHCNQQDSYEFKSQSNINIMDSFPHVNPVLLGGDVALAKSKSREVAPKRLDLEEARRVSSRYSGSTALQSHREMKKKRSSRRSDGGDSPVSSSSAEEYEKAIVMVDGTKVTRTHSGSADEMHGFENNFRAGSLCDNNNNSAPSSLKPHLSPRKSSDTESSNRLPDFDSIVDTVTAVRSCSIPGSKSDSGSSNSSTLAKTPAQVTVDLSGPQDDPTSNAKDEWAEIANIMSSIGGGLDKGPAYAKEFEQTFWQIMTGSDHLPRQVSTWLIELGLPQYEQVLTGNGFDDVDFLADDILEEQDLIDMDIKDASHRRRILESARNLPRLQPLSSSNHYLASLGVTEWLSTLHLSRYETAFRSNNYSTVAQLRTLAESEIKPLVTNRGHLKRILASLRSADQRKSPQSHLKSSRKSSASQTKHSPPLSRSPLLASANFFKDYSTIVNTRSTPTLSSTCSTNTSVPAFPSGTVDSTASSNSSNIGTNFYHSVEDKSSKNGRLTANAYESGRRASHQHSRNFSQTSLKTGAEESREPSGSSSNRSRSHRHQSSRDSDSKLRSRSSSSNRLQDSELSIFTEKGASKGNSAKPSSSRKSSSHRSKHSRSSQRRKNDEQLAMSIPVTSVPDTERAITLAAGGSLNLRPPNETTREVSVSSWRHPPDILINSCCNYQAYYLGSMLIRELKGIKSTMEACSKMKKSTDAMKKIPTITLSINYKGVKFIDSKSKHEIAEHEIQNISFASQDSDDLATFAYITHDVKTGHHYCHVFRVTTLDMAYEVILTLGQAFEVAYQLILKDKATKETGST